jgi:hypothetical protein
MAPRLIEPSIGDFGLVENSDQTTTCHSTVGVSPRHYHSAAMLIDDPSKLDEIIKRQSVYLNEEEIKFHEDQVYNEVLNNNPTEAETPLLVEGGICLDGDMLIVDKLLIEHNKLYDKEEAKIMTPTKINIQNNN